MRAVVPIPCDACCSVGATEDMLALVRAREQAWRSWQSLVSEEARGLKDRASGEREQFIKTRQVRESIPAAKKEAGHVAFNLHDVHATHGRMVCITCFRHCSLSHLFFMNNMALLYSR